MSSRQFGPQHGENSATFRLWAPAAKSVDAVVDGSRHQMARCGRGWFTVDVQGAAAGSRYRFRIDDEVDVPDPASAFQPEDVAGPSEIVDHDAFAWRARDWRGRPWHETVLLECHVGTFSPEGTYDGLIGKLDHIAQTGITAIELMPVGDFPGKRNWGYDGVLWYAPDHTYGSPDDLKRLIDEAHLRGIMVFLDVVYNHFGPEGNLLGRYAPQFFKNASTPWGSAIDYAVPEVKAFAIENALFWLLRLSLRRAAARCRARDRRARPLRAAAGAQPRSRHRSRARAAAMSISRWRMTTTALHCSMRTRQFRRDDIARSGTTTITTPGTYF